ncbi:MAG: hypothetical protein RLZZ546_1191 [Bacteroidota bacterium]
MKRQAINDLINWKSKTNRKPLIIQGVRQVGKTWLVKEFGKLYYKNFIYINFEKNLQLRSLFEQDFDIERIISILSIESSSKIDAKNTLIFFDEIQEAKNGITALKYFQEEAPQYHIIAAGSLLGISLHKGFSFPVGKVDFLTLYPFSFFEFLLAIDEEELAQLVIGKPDSRLSYFHEKLIHYLRLYYFIGGMPEALVTYVNTKDLDEVRAIQNKILLGYENDFSKYAPKDTIPRLRLVWNSIHAQLAKENKKFIYVHVAKGSRAKDFENAIAWLNDAGLIHKVNLITKPAIPLKSYAELDAFKLYFTDLGLLLAFAEIDKSIILEKNNILTEFKGAMTEQYVLQQLHCLGQKNIFYWQSDSKKAEVNFLIQASKHIIPIEVKAEENLQAKSLKVYAEKYEPKLCIRTSMSPYREEEWLTNIPLYAILSIGNNNK